MSRFGAERRDEGSALVIVLFFVILLTVIAIAFLARSLTAIKVAASSANETKAGLLANSASDIIIGDLKQEIIAGSAANAGTASYPVYVPTSALTMIPFQNGIPTSGTAIPNMISRSVSPANTTGAAPYVPYSAVYTGTLVPINRAANDSTANSGTYATSKVSSSTPSLNGRYISPSQWNSHYLIPRNTAIDAAGSLSTDSTPATSFVPPDWVIVTRAGANSVTWSSGTGGLNDPTLTNTNYAVGRYAYTIYNEGGLLDMNAAGYPEGPNGLTPIQSSQKSSLALADLTQLTAGTGTMTQAQVNNIVGWRNYASAQLSSTTGAFGNVTFSSSTASNWLTNFVLGNTNGFMKVVLPPAGVTVPPTDQAFLSRQQLISMMQSLSVSPDYLQYMATFTRGLEQPSFVPNPNRPIIVGTSTPPDPSAVNSYQGNNTYYGGEAAINMRGVGGFLGVRVPAGATWLRLDGTQVVPGEPLVKTKFALSRLALVTSNYGPTFSSAAAAASDPVYQRFGIYRASTSSPWIYDHGIAAGGTPSSASRPAIIGTLAEVAALSGSNAREPDFAELLKAAINVGSVGKAGPSGQGSNDQYRMDVSGDVQILQIMANLIDQQKTDNYPTWVEYNQTVSGSTVTRDIYGDQDLPYFYRWNFYGVTTQVPSPILSGTDSVTTGSGAILNHTRLQGASTLNPGSASYMIIPQVWNPHDANTPAASGGGPNTFRIVATTNYPGATSSSTAWGILAVPGVPVGASAIHFDGAPGGYESADCPETSAPAPLIMTSPPTPNSFIQFTDRSGGTAFREPTILWRNNFPSGVTLTGTSRQEDPTALTGNTYYGILVSDNVPVSWTWTDPVTKSNYISQTSTLQEGAYVPGASGSLPNNIDFQMQYLNTSGTWITYQETFVESTLTDYPTYTLFVNKNEPSYSGNNDWENPLASGVNGSSPPFMRQQSGTYDPRTNRFTAPIGGQYTADDPTLNGNPTLDAITLVANQPSSSGTINATVATSNFVLMGTNRPSTSRGQYWEYTTPCRGYDTSMHWYTSKCTTANTFDDGGTDANCFDGLLSQNNPSVQVLSDAGTTAQSYYYEDPDGIARRAMGGYVGVSGAPTGRLTNTSTTIGLPMATSGGTSPANYNHGIATPTSQSQSRPILLHRPFRNVAEMSYAFRGTPWKNVDFFTPESGDVALLDVFCVNEVPSSGLVAGKVDLNTRQAPVLKAIFSGAYRDEFANLATPPSSGTLPALSATETGNLVTTLSGITSSTSAWEGPLTNVADIVGHFVYPDPGALTATDVYQYTSPANNTEYTFSGFSAALSGANIWDSANQTSSQNIQRFRESAIRPLVSCGQARVWNLLIDLVVQTGRYPKTAQGLDQFLVDGQKRVWLHVAIDRLTGDILDKQVEVVTP